MINQVIEKLDKEATTEYTKVIAAYLKSKCQNDEDLCSMILDTDKSLTGCFTYVRTEAQKRAINGCCMMTDEEVFTLSEQYFGMTKPSINKEDVKSATVKLKSVVTSFKPITSNVPKKDNAFKKDTKKNDGNDIEGQTILFDFL